MSLAAAGFEPASIGYEPSKETAPPCRDIIVVLGDQPHISVRPVYFAPLVADKAAIPLANLSLASSIS